jgi:hypothetical protein
LLELGRAAEALAAFERVLALSPGLADALTGRERARAMLTQGAGIA